MSNRYFIVTPAVYESVRTAMDAASGFPNSEAATWFSPQTECPKDADGNCLLAAIEEVATNVAPVAVLEITQEQYEQLLPRPY